jgi:hypothetical protein
MEQLRLNKDFLPRRWASSPTVPGVKPILKRGY